MKTSQILARSLIGGLICLNLSFIALPAAAYNIEQISETPDKSDFAIGPGKHELLLAPGESEVKTISVTNRYPNEKKFQIDIEDFVGSRDLQSNIKLLADEKGPYSLKDYLHPEIMTFRLQHGDRITIPIRVEIPLDAQPGGLFGAVIVRSIPLTKEEEALAAGQAGGGITVVSRVASLFFVRVKGDATEDGRIKEFASDKQVYGEPPVNFRVIYENNGNVYLNPYGELTVNNAIGTKIAALPIDPYYVMPDSLRLQELKLERGFMFGRYTATLTLHRGYLENEVADSQTIAFWVLPWKVVIAIIIILFIIVLFFKGVINWFHKNFERKNPKKSEK